MKTLANRTVNPPSIRLGKRTSKTDSKKANKWLWEEAIIEAECRNDSWNKDMFCRMNPNKLTEAEHDLLTDYLFGETNIPIYPMIVETV